MANAIYSIAKQGFLTDITVGAFQGQMNWRTDTFGAALVKRDYQVNTELDISLDDIGVSNLIAGARVPLVTGNSGVRGQGATWGTAYSETVTFTGLPNDGTEAHYIVIYREAGTGDDLDNVLVAFLDTAENLPIILNGGDVEVRWDLGQGTIFRL